MENLTALWKVQYVLIGVRKAERTKGGHQEGFLEEVSPKLSSAENEARTWSLSATYAPPKTLTKLET